MVKNDSKCEFYWSFIKYVNYPQLEIVDNSLIVKIVCLFALQENTL